MGFTKITNSQLNSRGATTLPNQPTISAAALKQEFDAPAKQIVAPAVNNLIDELEASTSSSSLGVQAPTGKTYTTVQGAVNSISADLATVEGSAHTHSNKSYIDKISEDGSGNPLYDGNPIGAGAAWGDITGTLSAQTDLNTALSGKSDTGHTHTKSDITDFPSLATVATSGSYNDLSNKPSIPTVTDTYSGTSSDAMSGKAVASAIGTKSTVGWTQITTTGQKIATISLDGTPTDVYAPTGGGGGGGDMYKSVYDKNSNGIVDKAETLYDGTNLLSASILELNYVHGVTSNIQTQINGKAASSHTHTKSQITDLSIPTTLAELASDSTHKTVTDTQIGAWNAKQNALIVGTGIDITNNVISATASTAKGYKTVKVGSTDIDATAAEDYISLLAGSNITLTPDATNRTVTITSAGGGTGGHNMEPAPASNLTEDDVVNTIVGKVATEGGANEDVASVFGVAKWSNTMSKTYKIVGKANNTKIHNTGVGTWPADRDNPTSAELETWIPIPDLYGIGSSGADIEMTLGFDPALSGPIIEGGWLIDDNSTMSDGQGGSIQCGRLCIKFGNEISDAETHTAVVTATLTLKRSDIVEVG